MDQVKRLRGRTLQRLRAALLRDNPLCVVCASAGKTSEAIELDHIVALVNGGTNDPENMQGLCRSCHQDKTSRDMGFEPRTRFEAGRVVW